MHSHISSGRILATAAVTVALTLSWTGAAFAGAPEPTLGLAALRTRLVAAPAGGLSGYLKTVVRGATIETIPVDVLAVTGDAANSLILFAARGDKIASYGGIVSGMSGSPIYIDDGGIDKVIGALSYGDAFTLGGSGLATPIESMLKLTTDYAPRVQMLASPVRMSGHLVDRVVISADPSSLENVRASGAFVATPLASIFIGGLSPRSHAFTDLKRRFESADLSVVPLETALSSGASTFTTDLAPGSSVAALAARGDLWVGGLGTVTWTDGSTVLAFGHPAFFTGATDLFMTNAWVSGVWPSSYMPYKMGYPTAIRGTITQDRDAGIMGVLGAPPAETPLTARATSTDSGRMGDAAVYASSSLLDTGSLGGIPSATAYLAASRLFDAQSTPGSANATTTVVVNDGKRDYTVCVANVFDDAFDIPSYVGADADNIVYSLLRVRADGVEQPHIVSTDVQVSVSTRRASARIVGLALDEPLREGENRVTVSLLTYGLAATQTVETTLTVPEGTPLTGTITASGIRPSDLVPEEGDPDQGAARLSIAEVVDDLNATVPNNRVTVSFMPGTDAESEASAPADAVECTATLAWVVNGASRAQITRLTAAATPGTVPYGGSTSITGEITGPAGNVTVEIYGTRAGSATETLLARRDSTAADGALSYEVEVPGLTANTDLRVHVDGGPGYTPADATTSVAVRAQVRLFSSAHDIRFGRRVTLTARVTPRTARGTVRFQYYDSAQHRWRTVGTRMLRRQATYATASISWVPRWGRRAWRAVYLGDAATVGATSSSLTTRAH